jgi:hypothetical protein
MESVSRLHTATSQPTVPAVTTTFFAPLLSRYWPIVITWPTRCTVFTQETICWLLCIRYFIRFPANQKLRMCSIAQQTPMFSRGRRTAVSPLIYVHEGMVVIHIRTDNPAYLLCPYFVRRKFLKQSWAEIAQSTGWMVEVRFPAGEEIFLISIVSRPALGATQPPNQWISWPLSPRIKRTEREADHSSPQCPDRRWAPPSLLTNGYRGLFPQG